MFGLRPNKKEWQNLKSSLASPGKSHLRIVGSYYGFPGQELCYDEIHIDLARYIFAPTLTLFLLVDSSSDEAAFYIAEKGKYISARGFYEVTGEGHAPLIPWSNRLSAHTSRFDPEA